jgi:hypothetical protein
MPRFSTLSDAISNAINQQVPKTNFPDGSLINLQLGRTPYPQTSNYLFKTTDFTWGQSTWGLQSITTKYKPD